MQNNNRKMFFYCLILCAITGIVVCWYISIQDKKFAVVDAIKLFDGFNMKKDLEAIDKSKLQQQSRAIDSLDKEMQMAIAMKNADEANRISTEYAAAKAALENNYTRSNQIINEKVWKRLNPLLEEFGKKKGIHLIIGANGMGSVLYNDAYYDMTSDAVNFVNKRYEEGN